MRHWVLRKERGETQVDPSETKCKQSNVDIAGLCLPEYPFETGE